MRRSGFALLLATAALLAAPAAAFAHGIQGRADLPVPLIAFYWAAAAVLIISFVALGLAWRRPLLARLEQSSPAADPLPAAVAATTASHGVGRWLAGLAGCLIWIATIITSMFGSAELNDNPAPIIIFVVWWIMIAVIGGLIGDVWRAMHPIAFIARSAGFEEQRDEHPWPSSLGIWIGVAGLGAFIWLELVYPTAADVRLLGTLVLAWSVGTLAGMQRYGVRVWLDQAEPFAVYTRVLAHMAPRSGGRWRLPIIGLTSLRPAPGLVALVGLLIGSVSYDGLSRTLWWQRRVAEASVRLVEQDISARTAQLAFGTFGLVMMVLLAITAFLAAAQLSRLVGRLPRRTAWGTTAEAFAPSLVPIALAYVIAHYFSYVWFQSQRLIALASDPFGTGANLFGTAEFVIDYTTLSNEVMWGVQVGSIVIGHVLGLVLAHDRALEIAAADPSSRAVRSQWPMLALMVVYTVGGLYFLSEGLNA
ncbi:MAG: hypothetical protein ABI200_03560 [Gaiellales bacterium]